MRNTPYAGTFTSALVAAEIDRQLAAPSAEPTSEFHEASKRVGCSEVVVLGVSSAVDYVRQLHQQASNYYAAARDHIQADRKEAALNCIRIAEAYEHANEEFRRLMASAELRQPQHNDAGQPRAELAPSKSKPR